MANNPGAKKAIRKIARRTEVNKARRSRVRTFVRKFEEALAAGDLGLAKTAFVEGAIWSSCALSARAWCTRIPGRAKCRGWRLS